MPSCAIKWCKNNTKIHKKRQGVTFHTFPTNILIRDEWVKAIRLSRNDPQWQPSPSSVVCSNHFEKTDMYDTKNGLRRIHRTGYPKKKLLPPSDANMTNIFWPNIPHVPNLRVSPSVVIDSNLELPSTSSAAVRELPDKPKRDVDQVSLVDTPRKNYSNLELPSTSSAAVRELPDKPKRDVDQGFIFHTYRTYKLRQKIRKRELLLKKNAAKIKILLQKIRRLEKKKLSLKELIKKLKCPFLINTSQQ